MKDDKKTILFEETPVPKAVMTLAVPTVVGCLVMILYNLADTYFVGMLNNPVETAAVTLGATVILAFNAVTNLFCVGASNIRDTSKVINTAEPKRYMNVRTVRDALAEKSAVKVLRETEQFG